MPDVMEVQEHKACNVDPAVGVGTMYQFLHVLSCNHTSTIPPPSRQDDALRVDRRDQSNSSTEKPRHPLEYCPAAHNSVIHLHEVLLITIILPSEFLPSLRGTST